VENAIKHGVARTPGGGEVGIDITRDGPLLRIAVDNPGQWQPGSAPSADSTGLGLANLRERLRLALGEGAGLILEREGDHTRARLRLPIVPAHGEGALP
jgi:hypothetical protein